MIVIDVGCADYGRYDSIKYLIDHVADGRAPEIIYGCDPSPSMDELIMRYHEDPPVVTSLMLKRAAAWTYDGEIGFVSNQLGSYVTEEEGAGEKVECFDLASFIRSLPAEHEIVLKMDAEGAEYTVLPHLARTRTDELLKFAWIEWHPWPHGDRSRRRGIEEMMSCPLEEWQL